MRPFFALLALLAFQAVSATEIITRSEELALIEYAEANGAKINIEISRSCPTCLRGAFAKNDLKRGDNILAIPMKLGTLMTRIPYQAWAAEYARGFIQRLRLDPEFNATHRLLLSTWPKPEEFLTSETFPEDLFDALQTPELVHLIKNMRSVSEEVYNGQYEPVDYTPMDKVLKGDKAVSLEEFLYYTSMIATRDSALSPHTVPDEETEDTPVVWLVPVSDMINHADKPNSLRTDNGTHLLVMASKEIKKGEEVTNSYQPLAKRNDMSLLLYGFVEERNKLCAVDLPTYDPDNVWVVPKADTHYYGPNGKYNTPEEAARLKTLLAAMPTSEEEDEALLAGGKLRDWKEETVVAFRLGRKRMLKKAIAAVEAELSVNDEEKSNHDEL